MFQRTSTYLLVKVLILKNGFLLFIPNIKFQYTLLLNIGFKRYIHFLQYDFFAGKWPADEEKLAQWYRLLDYLELRLKKRPYLAGDKVKKIIILQSIRFFLRIGSLKIGIVLRVFQNTTL